ncbi:MAG: benzoylsuccinyl-CoA thiolase [Actinomycetia bacterium]|nr:benzoylsuccinyl-CoA thiolase [Actinomycetes bacterium]
MAETTRRRPAVEGWFHMPEAGSGDQPALIGTRCTESGTYFFPPERVMSRAPGHADSALQEVQLSTRGKLWSYTDAQYQPPPPYVPVTEPHEPFCIAAVELEDEKMVVMGQVPAGVTVDQLTLGMEMELVLDTLFVETDEESGRNTEVVTWKWAPVGLKGSN